MGAIISFIFLLILTYLIAKFVFNAKLEHEERKKKKLDNTVPEDENIPAFKQALRITQISEFVVSSIKIDAKIKSDLMYLEVVFFFYFINNVSLSILEAPASTTVRVLPMLQDVLSHDDKSQYKEHKEIVDKLINHRFRTYFDMMYKYSEKLTAPFLQDAYRYLAELIHYTILYDDFMAPKQQPFTLQVWEDKTATFEYLKKITETMNKNNVLIFKFATSKAFDKNKNHNLKLS